MAANLTQRYRKAERAYRDAQTAEEELDCLRVLFRELPKHKGTERLQADLKQKISLAKKACLEGRTTGKATRLRIPHQGAGRVLLIGAPNVGKSQLLKTLSKAEPEIAAYPFSTREPTPGMMPYEDILVQLIDTPPITSDYLDADTQALIRGADLVLLLVDLSVDRPASQAREVVDRLMQTKTQLATSTYLSPSDVGLALTETFLVLNKIDLPDARERAEAFRESSEFEFRRLSISAESGEGVNELRESVFRALDVVRVYTKMPNQKEADFQKPFTIRRGGSLGDVAELIHHDLAENLRFARVWGSKVHDGAVVKRDYIVHDKDIVEIH